jgi:glyoxylase-like metal-dependent hydrolase (beta-lactamase superfamily II)
MAFGHFAKGSLVDVYIFNAGSLENMMLTDLKQFDQALEQAERLTEIAKRDAKHLQAEGAYLLLQDRIPEAIESERKFGVLSNLPRWVRDQDELSALYSRGEEHVVSLRAANLMERDRNALEAAYQYARVQNIHVIHVRNGHTDGDSIVYFSKSNVIHMGDDFLRIGFPFVDLDSGGNVLGWIGALEEVIARLPPDVKIIPGHGPVSNLDDVREFIKMMKDTRGAVARGVQQGKSLDQLKREKVLEPWSNWSGEWISSDLYLETLYNDLFRGAETFAHRP